MPSTTAPRAITCSAWQELRAAGIPAGYVFHTKADSPTTAVVIVDRPEQVADVATALARAGYDVHTPTDRPNVVEAQHYAHAAAELAEEATAAELAGDLQRAEEKRHTAALCLQLLGYAADAWTARTA